jgi:hypothetical protein
MRSAAGHVSVEDGEVVEQSFAILVVGIEGDEDGLEAQDLVQPLRPPLLANADAMVVVHGPAAVPLAWKPPLQREQKRRRHFTYETVDSSCPASTQDDHLKFDKK